MTKEKVKIGLFGFGCVGQGLYDVLNNSRGFRSEIKKIVVKNPGKKRKLPIHYFAYDKNEILNDPEINLVVELIDNADDAFEIVKSALSNGKNVVTANKKMIAEHFEELVSLQVKYGTSVLYEASSCGSIPILRTLEEYYDNELLKAVSGIFNGSSNYILTKMQNENIDYQTALQQAKDLGFAESNPKLDVEGYDAKYKLMIVAGHSHGVFTRPEEVLNLGIQNLTLKDIEYAKKNNLKIRLIANTYKLDESRITLYVTPQFVTKDDPLYNVNYEYNAVTVEAAFSDKQLFIGKGAGGYPTGSAVLSDISANSYSYRYEYKKFHQADKYHYSTDVLLEIYARGENREALKEIDFETITEQGEGFTRGLVSLGELLRKKIHINTSGIFVAATGKHIIQPAHYAKESVEKAALS